MASTDDITKTSRCRSWALVSSRSKPRSGRSRTTWRRASSCDPALPPPRDGGRVVGRVTLRQLARDRAARGGRARGARGGAARGPRGRGRRRAGAGGARGAGRGPAGGRRGVSRARGVQGRGGGGERGDHGSRRGRVRRGGRG